MPRIRMIKEGWDGIPYRDDVLFSHAKAPSHKNNKLFFVARQEETKWEAKGVGVGVAVAKGVRKVLKARQIWRVAGKCMPGGG